MIHPYQRTRYGLSLSVLVKHSLPHAFGLVLLIWAQVSAAFTCTPLATINKTNGGIFSLESFKGQLYIGMFGYGQSANTGMIYRYNEASNTTTEILGLSQNDLGVSESVCALKAFNGYLYAATEEQGKIFRSLNGTSWQLVHTGNYPTACALEVHNNTLYTSTAHTVPQQERGEILSSASGNSDDWQTALISGEPGYIREIVSHNNTLLAFSVLNGAGRWLSSSNGTNWSNQTTHSIFNTHVRGFRALSDNNNLWLTTTKYGASNTHSEIWRIQNNGPTRLFQNNHYSHITGVIKGFDTIAKKPIIIASTSAGFKTQPSGRVSAILSSGIEGNTWLTQCTFASEEGIWAITEHNNDIYFGTMHGGERGSSGGFGRLFRIQGVRKDSPVVIAPIMLLLQ